MDPKQFEAMLSDAEIRLRRLKTLYDQWFSGLERTEPAVPRKELEDLLAKLRREQVKNTALRFRVQQLVQRHTTFSTHWRRIARQIEEGTFKRDVLRARRRSQHKPQLEDAESELSYEIDVELDLDAPDEPAEPAVQPVAPAQPPASAVAPARVAQPAAPKNGAGARPNAAPPLAAVAAVFGVASSVAQAGRADAAASHGSNGSNGVAPQAVSASVPKPAGAVHASAPGAKATPPAPAGANAAAPPGAPGVRNIAQPVPAAPARVPPPAPAAAASSAKPATPARVPAPTPATTAAAGDVVKPAVPKPPAQAAASAAGVPPARPTQLGVGPRAAGATPPMAAAKLAQPSPANGNAASALSSDDLQRIYSSYLAARKQNSERVDNVKLDSIEKTLRGMLPSLEKKHAGKKIDFEVVVKDGKVALKPVAK